MLRVKFVRYTRFIMIGMLGCYSTAGSTAPIPYAPDNDGSASQCDGAQDCSETKPEYNDNLSWIDQRHAYVSNQADDLAQWLDGFFGVPRDDLESAHSRLRLRIAHHFDEIENTDTDLRIRGKVFLPRISQRLSLIFSDNESDEEEEGEDLNTLDPSADDSGALSVQYNYWDRIRSRLDFSLGVRSGLEPTAAIRYRHEIPIKETYLARYSQRVFVRSDEGLGTVARVDLDRALSNKRLLRFANRFKFGEESDGVEWQTRVLHGKKLGGEKAVNYFIFANGATRPEQLTTSYGLGLLYRINFFRPWLFAEVEPSYAWRREELEDNREGAARLTLRLELKFESGD